jgi:thiol-disulfide isomerase/thioredoxin
LFTFEIQKHEYPFGPTNRVWLNSCFIKVKLKKMTKKLLFIFTLLPGMLLSQHSIKGTFTPAKEYKWIILYKVTPTTSIYVDNAEIAKDGSFEISLDSLAVKGVYRIVYAVPQEQFNFDIIYDKKEDIELTFSQDNGVNFVKSNENKLLTSYTRSIMMVNETINRFYSTNSKDEKTFTHIFKTLDEAQKSFEEASQGTIAHYFIKSNSPYIPESYEDIRTYSKNLRNNYLKHVDFNDPVLQSSEFLIERMLGYVFGMTSNPDDLDAFKTNVDDIVKAIKSTQPDYQKTLLEILWNQFVDIENETMANYVASNYLIPISEELNDGELTTKLIVYKNTSINAFAPDFPLTIKQDGNEVTKKLSELDIANRYVIVFWSSSCSHCLKELPELKKYLQTPGKDTKVIAIGLEDEPYNWNNEILYYPDFIHVYGKGKWDNPIGDSYGVSATPTYFVLNKDKQIIAKPYDFEALKTFLEKNPVKAHDSKKED